MFVNYKVTGYTNIITGYFGTRKQFADWMKEFGDRIDIIKIF